MAHGTNTAAQSAPQPQGNLLQEDTDFTEMKDLYETGHGQFRRKDITRLLERYGFEPITNVNDAHARWRWTSSNSKKINLGPFTVGLPGHGRNPVIDRVYVGKAIEALEDVIKGQQAYLVTKNSRAIVSIEDRKDETGTKPVFEDITLSTMDLLGDYAIAVRPSMILIRHPMYPEIGTFIPANASEDIVLDTLIGLDSMAAEHTKKLAHLEKTYGYVVVRDPVNGTRLSNSGYGLKTITLPKFGKDKFYGPKKEEALTQAELEMAALDQTLKQAADTAEKIQDDILQVLDDMKAAGLMLEATEHEESGHDGIAHKVRVFKINNLPSDQEIVRESGYLEQSKLGTRAMAQNTPLRSYVTQTEHLKDAIMGPHEKELGVKEDGSWTIDQEGDLRAPVMDKRTLDYLKSTISEYKAEAETSLTHFHKYGGIQKTHTTIPDGRGGQVDAEVYSSPRFGRTLTLEAGLTKLQRAIRINEYAMPFGLISLRNIRINEMLKDMGCNGGQFTDQIKFQLRPGQSHRDVPQLMSKTATIFPDASGKIVIESHDHFGARDKDLTITVENTTPQNYSQLRDELINAKRVLLHRIENKLVAELVKSGFTYNEATDKTVTGTLFGEEQGERRFTPPKGGEPIVIPIANMYENNGAAVYAKFKHALGLGAMVQAEDRVEAVMTEFKDRYGFTVTKTPDPTPPGDSIKLERPRAFDGDKMIKSISFSTKYPARMDAVFSERDKTTGRGKDGDIALVRAACEERADRLKAVRAKIAGSNQYTIEEHTVDGVTTIQLKDAQKPEGTKDPDPVLAYGSAQIMGHRDLRMLEQTVGIETKGQSHKR